MSDPRLDELLALGERCVRISALQEKIKPCWAGDDDQRALHRIGRVLREEFWRLSRSIAEGVPK
jgi:hypothetical protein